MTRVPVDELGRKIERALSKERLLDTIGEPSVEELEPSRRRKTLVRRLRVPVQFHQYVIEDAEGDPTDDDVLEEVEQVISKIVEPYVIELSDIEIYGDEVIYVYRLKEERTGNPTTRVRWHRYSSKSGPRYSGTVTSPTEVTRVPKEDGFYEQPQIDHLFYLLGYGKGRDRRYDLWLYTGPEPLLKGGGVILAQDVTVQEGKEAAEKWLRRFEAQEEASHGQVPSKFRTLKSKLLR